MGFTDLIKANTLRKDTRWREWKPLKTMQNCRSGCECAYTVWEGEHVCVRVRTRNIALLVHPATFFEGFAVSEEGFCVLRSWILTKEYELKTNLVRWCLVTVLILLITIFDTIIWKERYWKDCYIIIKCWISLIDATRHWERKRGGPIISLFFFPLWLLTYKLD